MRYNDFSEPDEQEFLEFYFYTIFIISLISSFIYIFLHIIPYYSEIKKILEIILSSIGTFFTFIDAIFFLIIKFIVEVTKDLF